MATAVADVEVGWKAPEFSLPSSKGQVALGDYRGKSGVVLYFIREFGCMSCQMHAGELVKLYTELQASGYDVLVIGGGNEGDAAKMAARIKAPFPIAADNTRGVYGSYNVEKALGFIQRSATFIVNKEGKIIFAHRATNPGSSLNTTDLMAAIKA